jgi:hypothetical protein
MDMTELLTQLESGGKDAAAEDEDDRIDKVGHWFRLHTTRRPEIF